MHEKVVTIGLEKQCDIVCDLSKKKLPFPDSYFDFIWAHQVIEHFPNTLEIMKECLRVLKPEGKMEIHVPHYLHGYAWGNPTHYRCFTRNSLSAFTDENKGRDTYGLNIKVESRLLWYSHTVPKEGRFLARLMNSFMTWFINRFPGLYDNHLVFLVGPPEEIVYIVEKIDKK